MPLLFSKRKRKLIAMNIKRPHDSFFKQLMSDPKTVRDFLRSFLPKTLSEKIDYESIKVIDTEKTNRKYRKFYLDLLVDCRVLEKESEIYIVFEHKSYPDRLTLIQILNYCSVVWEGCIRNKKPLIPIIPVVFYHGRKRFDLPTNFSGYFDVDEAIRDYLVDFSIVLFDTNRHTDEDILRASGNLYLAASILAMKHIFRDIKSLRPVFKQIVQLDRDRFLMVLEYVIMTKDIKEEELEELIKEAGGDTMPSLAQRWLEQGIQQGMLQDAREMVLDALEAKFGESSVHFKVKIDQVTDRNKLKELLKIILKIQDIKELESSHIWN
ncbi:MAG: hypothetical protein C4B58_10180 [Deltaproteobacteria bacterium]|nr:MAG: hypothetical protein C4B58_10180 [Deltaproteobacteria bacterium]